MKKSTKLLSTLMVAGMLLTGCEHMKGDKHAVYFQSGSAQLSQAGINELRKIANTVNENAYKGQHMKQDLDVRLIGHTDNVGDWKANRELAKRRINAVNDKLIEFGVDPLYISSVAQGEGWMIEKSGNSDKSKRRVDVNLAFKDLTSNER